MCFHPTAEEGLASASAFTWFTWLNIFWTIPSFGGFRPLNSILVAGGVLFCILPAAKNRVYGLTLRRFGEDKPHTHGSSTTVSYQARNSCCGGAVHMP